MKKIIFLLLAIATIFTACKNAAFSDSHDIKGLNWDEKDIQTFEATMKPSGEQLFDIKATIRYASKCPIETLVLHYRITMPDGTMQEKQADAIINQNGKNMGEGLGDIWDVKAFLLEDLKFPEGGKVKIEIGHNMPNPKVPLIMKIGTEIVKQTN
jgi:gliding motility-associated lipoprotein GldH